MREYRDASNRLSFGLSDMDSDFTFFSQRMQSLHGTPVQTLQDTMYDQRWWDFHVGGTTVVLHTDAMAGVSLDVEDGTHEDLLREIVDELIKEERTSRSPVLSGVYADTQRPLLTS